MAVMDGDTLIFICDLYNFSMGLDWQASELKFTCSWWYKENKSYWIDYDV